MKRILVVDDQPALRRLMDVVLSEAGFEVQLAEGGAEALEAVRAAPPEVCVLDVMMPRVNGWEVLEALRADPATEDLPVVMLTAKGDPRDRLRGWELGCDAYLPKPFDPPDVVNEVMAVLTREPAERQALRERQLTVVRAMLSKSRERNGRKVG
jgi:DNA-binding response OmpR family regulator